MNNNIGDVLYRKRAAHIGAITAKLSIAAVIFTVIIGAGMVVHQMIAALRGAFAARPRVAKRAGETVRLDGFRRRTFR